MFQVFSRSSLLEKLSGVRTLQTLPETAAGPFEEGGRLAWGDCEVAGATLRER